MPVKKSVSETGHGKNLENYKKLRGFVSGWGAAYQPGNPNNLLKKMDSIIVAADAGSDALTQIRAPYRAASAAADDAFEPLSKLVTRITRGFKASGAPDSAIEDLMSDARQIQGRRKTPVKTDDPTTPNINESEKSNSVSQMSRNNRVAALDAMIATLDEYAAYHPNEPDLQTAALSALSADLKTHIANVNDTFTAVSNELNNRDAIYYENDDSLVKTAQSIKNYVISAFGTNSPEHNQIRGLEFKTYKRR